jgi:urease accessory protein
MLTFNKLLPAGQGLAPVLVKRAATVELDWDVRQKSRFDAKDSNGREMGVFLSRGVAVRGGDVLVGEDGSFVRVVAAPQPVLVVRQGPHGTPFDLVRAAYHLGNRHVPLQLAPDHLKLEPDHVLADMLRMMGLSVAEANEGFDPEGGAYSAETQAHAHSHAPAPAKGPDAHGRQPGDPHYGHNHGHGEDHHDHGHDHGHGSHDHAHASHAKGPDKFGRLPDDPHYGHNHR